MAGSATPKPAAAYPPPRPLEHRRLLTRPAAGTKLGHHPRVRASSQTYRKCVSNQTSRYNTHNPVHSLAIVDGSVLEVLASEGEWLYTGTADPYSVAETVRVYHLGAVIAERIGGGSYFERSDPASVPVAFLNPHCAFPWVEGESDDTYSGEPITAGEGPGIGVGGGTLRDMFGATIAYTVGDLGYVNNRLPATIGGTWAADSRGNYLSAVEIPTLSGAAQPNPHFPFSDSDTVGGKPVIAGTGSGTYTDAAGGPDSLTPATVATLTSHPGDDRWNIGVF